MTNTTLCSQLLNNITQIYQEFSVSLLPTTHASCILTKSASLSLVTSKSNMCQSVLLFRVFRDTRRVDWVKMNQQMLACSCVSQYLTDCVNLGMHVFLSCALQVHNCVLQTFFFSSAWNNKRLGTLPDLFLTTERPFYIIIVIITVVVWMEGWMRRTTFQGGTDTGTILH